MYAAPLRHIGLLKPTRLTQAGYRLYNEEALRRLQTILLFRELQFPLKEIKAILDSPEFDPMPALEQQIRLLELQRKHLDSLIAYAHRIQKEGRISMDFSVFDRTEIDTYTAEAKAKWGNTDAYHEFERKTKGQTSEQIDATGDALMDIFAQFGALRHLTPDSKEVQALVAKLQSFISEHYYTCTKEILQSLGQMYIAGDSMTENINKAGGKGTARFVHEAIEIYCK